ncbi:MAG: hypothetical protein II874_03895 [Bacteroidales bacterium]|nr:hypothetical protein [Bacteroidales bacterium]
MMVTSLPADFDLWGIYPVTEICKILGICRQTLYNYEAAGMFTFDLRTAGRKRPQRVLDGFTIRDIFRNVNNS